MQDNQYKSNHGINVKKLLRDTLISLIKGKSRDCYRRHGFFILRVFGRACFGGRRFPAFRVHVANTRRKILSS